MAIAHQVGIIWSCLLLLSRNVRKKKKKMKRGRRPDDDDVAEVEYVDLRASRLIGVRSEGLVLELDGEVKLDKSMNKSLLLGRKVRLFNVKRSRRSSLWIMTPSSCCVVVVEEERKEEEKKPPPPSPSTWSCVMCGFANNFKSSSVCFSCRSDKRHGPNSRMLWDLLLPK